jgi:hypothetical protein
MDEEWLLPTLSRLDGWRMAFANGSNGLSCVVQLGAKSKVDERNKK